MVICRSAADIFAYNVSMLVNGAYMVQELCCISSRILHSGDFIGFWIISGGIFLDGWNYIGESWSPY